MFRNVFKKTYAKIEPGNEKLDIPEGLWLRQIIILVRNVAGISEFMRTEE